MQTGRMRAVTACLDSNKARRYAEALEAAGFACVAAVYAMADVLPALKAHRPRLLLSDAILPGGDGVALAQAVSDAPLNLYPHVLLIDAPRLPLPGVEALNALNAALLEGLPTPEALRRTLTALEARATRLPPARDSRLEALLDRLGVPGHPGRALLKNAVALCWRDRDRLSNLRDRVYPDAARPLGKTGAQAERAIRHVIDAAWRTGEIDEQQRIFGDTIDARRGRPTCGEMIAQLADILRWEG